MSSEKTDIIVLGATGFTGHLITRYLASHPQFTQGLFSFSIAARSQSKIHTLVQELSLPPHVNTIQIDVTDASAIEALVQTTKVVINTVGPYWRWGTLVVRACARHGIHYVDLTGETVWIKHIIDAFDYLATKSGAIIVPSCGMDSVPSDISAFLSNKTLKAYGQYDVGTSTTAYHYHGGISGGTLSTLMTMLEEVPESKMTDSKQDFSLSPVEGGLLPAFRFLYNLAIPGDKPILGGFFVMQPTNRKLVQRTFGLLELQAIESQCTHFAPGPSSELAKNALREHYGRTFRYDEFIVMPSRLSAIFFTTAFAFGIGMLSLVAPVRWLFKKWMTQPGDGPSEEEQKKGSLEGINHTISTSNPPVHVKTTLKGDGDPGYLLTSIMISESALSLILPPTSVTSSPSYTPSPDPKALPAGLSTLAHQGGILTPMTAFGDVLIQRLRETGKFEFESHIVEEESGQVEGRKDV
ncbi:hypothetical protein Hypma_007419 [Hypsizygus marmoreus]|uniref:Saccharopine dehydrogenase NADP binding domain-containing protein n=1 Tax=Hypsizygus marmoreus TaxID=39966 RepID=A0A369K033_HYPMA|nr:hypothetical protein Hypma_007419 [Hypsizygus marmoreus]